MKKFDYNEVAKEIGWDFSKMNYKTEHPSGYNYYKTVVSAIMPETIILDIGCGSGEKALRYYSLAKKIEMLDIEPEMIKKVNENYRKYYSVDNKKFNFSIYDGKGELPYKDESFDLVVSRHCGANMNEVYRILRKGGIFISEDYDETNCLELKELFRSGQGYENLKNDIREKRNIMNICLDLGFSKIELLNFDEIEYYKTKEDLEYLLTHTPILDSYEEKDKKTLDKYIKEFITPKGIRLNRKLYAFFIVK